MKTQNLYEVTLKRTSYGGKSSSVETRQLFATSPKDINTYRLGGFQQDSIEILKAKKIRARKPIEIDVDLERNELSLTVDVIQHLNRCLEPIEGIEDEQELLDQGYEEVCHDNSYNWSSDFSDDIDFKVYSKKKNRDWFYDKDAIVQVSIHRGLDARAGYKDLGFFKPRHDLAYLIEGHVRIYVIDENGNEVDSYDGDGAAYSLTKEYTLVNHVTVKNSEGEEFTLSFYHPVEGI